MSRMSNVALAVTAVVLLALGSVSAAIGPPALEIPAGFRHWYFVNSMIITKDSPRFRSIDGLHHIYVNDIGLPRLMKGGSTPYPDGTLFVDDVRDVSLVDGAFLQGSRKAIPVMLKDSKKYAATGGWGYAQFDKDGKPGPESDLKKCFPCHQAIKDRDFVFTRYTP